MPRITLSVVPLRRRMTPDQRREQLLDIGEQLFDEGEFDELSMDEIAGRAGVTRALLYHYFASKAAFFAAVWERAHEALGAASVATESRTVREWAAQLLASYVAFYEQHPQLVLLANRSPMAADPVLRQPISAHFRSVGGVLLDAAGCRGEQRPIAEAAFDGWIAFVRETSLAALVERSITPLDSLSLCMAALDATVGQHADLGAAVVADVSG